MKKNETNNEYHVFPKSVKSKSSKTYPWAPKRGKSSSIFGKQAKVGSPSTKPTSKPVAVVKASGMPTAISAVKRSEVPTLQPAISHAPTEEEVQSTEVTLEPTELQTAATSTPTLQPAPTSPKQTLLPTGTMPPVLVLGDSFSQANCITSYCVYF